MADCGSIQELCPPPSQFRDGLAIRYQRPSPCLSVKYDGCSANFTLQHALDCKKGGLVIQRHNESLVIWQGGLVIQRHNESLVIWQGGLVIQRHNESLVIWQGGLVIQRHNESLVIWLLKFGLRLYENQ